jgi:hypothetical protein
MIHARVHPLEADETSQTQTETVGIASPRTQENHYIEPQAMQIRNTLNF